MLEGILGSLVWVVANFAYGSYLRDGERGFKRLAAFCARIPSHTLCGLFHSAKEEHHEIQTR